MSLLRTPVRAFLIPLVTVLFLALPAQAALKWCKADPIVRLDGVEYQLIVAVPEGNAAEINGPLRFEIYSPKGTTQELLFTDAGYNGHGEKVVMKRHKSENTHRFYLRVPRSKDHFPVADSFDSMAMARPYRAGLPMDIVLSEFRKSRGHHWDERVVDTLLTLIAQGCVSVPGTVTELRSYRVN